MVEIVVKKTVYRNGVLNVGVIASKKLWRPIYKDYCRVRGGGGRTVTSCRQILSLPLQDGPVPAVACHGR